MLQFVHRLLAGVFIVALTLLPLCTSASPVARAAADITFVPGTVSVAPPVQAALQTALSRAAASQPAFTLAPYYAVTHVQRAGVAWFVSLAGLGRVNADQSWSLEDDAVWVGLVLLVPNDGVGATETYTGAVQGTPEFTTLLARVPNTVLDETAKVSLDPRRRPRTPAAAYRLPWQTGTNMLYGTLGVHAGDFVSVVGPNYKAVDMLSDANTALGHAPNRLLAAAAGAIDYVCSDGTNVAVRLSQDLLYVHLVMNSKLVVGHSFAQGDEMGQLKTGTFSANCGHGSQAANWFHVHWAFPNSSPFQAGGWALNLSDGIWRRGAETRSTGQWLLAEDTTSSAWHVEYFGDVSLTTRCADLYETTTYVFKLWNSAAPASGCPADRFSARFTRQVTFQNGAFNFHVDHDDGARLFIDGQNALDAWQEGLGSHEITRTLSGAHEIRVEYEHITGTAGLSAWWNGSGALPADALVNAAAWKAEYYGNRLLWGNPALVQNEGSAALAHDWGSAGPGYGLPGQDFSARYTRTVTLPCGRYRFYVHVDDGVRLWAGQRLLLNEWREQLTDFTPELDWDGGALPLKVEYFQRDGGAALAVNWQRISTAPCIDALPDLRPYTPASQPAPLIASATAGTNVSGTLVAGQPAYFTWRFANDGYASTSTPFAVELSIDGVTRYRGSFSNLEPGLVFEVSDWATTVLTSGAHTVRLVIDPDNGVSELDETNNTWQGTLVWQAGAQQGPAARQHMVYLPLIQARMP
jgi:hypothetical protein